jgi:hypothetical protein
MEMETVFQIQFQLFAIRDSTLMEMETAFHLLFKFQPPVLKDMKQMELVVVFQLISL